MATFEVGQNISGQVQKLDTKGYWKNAIRVYVGNPVCMLGGTQKTCTFFLGRSKYFFWETFKVGQKSHYADICDCPGTADFFWGNSNFPYQH